jgi:hypothetical protein
VHDNLHAAPGKQSLLKADIGQIVQKTTAEFKVAAVWFNADWFQRRKIVAVQHCLNIFQALALFGRNAKPMPGF